MNKNHFIGFTEVDGKIDRAFACGIKGENPNNNVAFCVEGSLSDIYGGRGKAARTFSSNSTLLNTLYGPYDSGTDLGCINNGYYSCKGLVKTYLDEEGYVYTESNGEFCEVVHDGSLQCFD